MSVIGFSCIFSVLIPELFCGVICVILRKSGRFSTIPTYDRQTERRTVRWIDRLTICASIASPGKRETPSRRLCYLNVAASSRNMWMSQMAYRTCDLRVMSVLWCRQMLKRDRWHKHVCHFRDTCISAYSDSGIGWASFS